MHMKVKHTCCLAVACEKEVIKCEASTAVICGRDPTPASGSQYTQSGAPDYLCSSRLSFVETGDCNWGHESRDCADWGRGAGAGRRLTGRYWVAEKTLDERGRRRRGGGAQYKPNQEPNR